MAPPCTPSAFLTRLIDLTTQEQSTEELESSLLSSSVPFSQLIAKGLALGGLTAAKISLGLGGRTLVELERSLAHHQEGTFPPHGFRSGDSVSILGDAGGKGKSKGKKAAAEEEQGLEGVVWKVQETRIVVALGQSGRAGGQAGNDKEKEDVEIPTNCRLYVPLLSPSLSRRALTFAELPRLKLSNPSTYLRQSTSLHLALDQLSSPHPPALFSLLLGLRPPHPPLALPSEFSFLDGSLNDSQRQAVKFVLEGELGLIWGPPGTGKTQTVVEVIRQLVARGERVLVCGGSNLSGGSRLLSL